MPTTVEKTKTIEINGKDLEMKPLKIGRLKKLMKEFDKLQSVKSSEGSLDALLKCCVVAMEQYDPELASVEVLEEILDIDDMYSIIEAASGIRLDESGKENQGIAVESPGKI